MLWRLLLALALLLPALPAWAAAAPTVPPMPAVNNEDPFFGAVQGVYAPQAARLGGVRWQRLVFWWSRMQPNGPGDPLGDSWFTDAEIDAQVAAGMEPVGVILSTPAWARRDPGADHNSVPTNLDLPAGDPANHWAQFMAKLAEKYRGRINTWIIWNEPDMYVGEERRTWSGGVDDYYRLLRGAYLGAKSTNPNARIFVSGMTYWWDKENGRRQFLEDLLDRIAADGSAAQNNHYFDGISVHAYANPLNSFAIPTIYRQLMQARGMNKPIWIQESNVVPRDDPVLPMAGAFRASLDEQASFVIQSMALARAAGVERAAIYKLSDTGGENNELYGLVRDDGTARPAFAAYQVAATYFSNVRSATYGWSGADPATPAQLASLLRSNEGRHQFVWPAVVNRVVMQRLGERITVVWNAGPQPARATLPALGTSARLVDKLGNATTIAPRDGAYGLDLEPSGNNSDPRDPSLYLVGGSPLILVESTAGVTPPVTPPSAAVDARIQIVWAHGGAPVDAASRANVSAYLFDSGGLRPVACDFSRTVRLWAALNNKPARPIAVATRRAENNAGMTITAFDFDDVDVSPARDPRNKLYFFVTVDGVATRSGIWSHGADARTYFPQPDVPTGVGAPTTPEARIQIVWPHGDAPVSQARRVNITAAVFERGGLRSADATFGPTLRLYRALNSAPGEPVATGARRLVTAGGITYPLWDFNDVDVAAANDSANKYYFWVAANGAELRSNVWSHGADARTIFPRKDVPAESCR